MGGASVGGGGASTLPPAFGPTPGGAPEAGVPAEGGAAPVEGGPAPAAGGTPPPTG